MVIRKINIGILFLFCAYGIMAQDSLSYEYLIFDDEHYKTTPTYFDEEGIKWNNIPLSRSLVKQTPYAGNQKKVPSCVIWTVGYGALSFYKAKTLHLYNRSRITRMAYPANCFLEKLNAKMVRQKGLLFKDIFNALTKTQIHQSCQNENPLINVRDIKTVFKLNDDRSTKILKLKKAIAEGHPVVVGIYMHDNLSRRNVGKKTIDLSGEYDEQKGHALLVVGYDDRTQQFEVMNSRGTLWGNDGNIKVDYQQFARLLRYGYLLQVETANF